MPVDALTTVRDRVLPMFEVVAKEYADRTPRGYPVILDEADRGAISLQMDGSHSLHIVSDGEQLYVDLTTRSSRTEAGASASREKFSGMPEYTRRPFDPAMPDTQLRNLVSELVSAWNRQPSIIRITDT